MIKALARWWRRRRIRRQRITTTQRFMRRELRLVLLRCMLESDGSANDSMLTRMVFSWGGIRAPRERVRQTIEWLAEHGFVRVKRLHGGSLLRVEITEGGRRIANGDDTHPEIHRRADQAV